MQELSNGSLSKSLEVTGVDGLVKVIRYVVSIMLFESSPWSVQLLRGAVHDSLNAVSPSQGQ